MDHLQDSRQLPGPGRGKIRPERDLNFAPLTNCLFLSDQRCSLLYLLMLTCVPRSRAERAVGRADGRRGDEHRHDDVHVITVGDID